MNKPKSIMDLFQKDQPIFSETDYQCLRQSMNSLSDDEFKIIIMRFWEHFTIDEIAKVTRLSWD